MHPFIKRQITTITQWFPERFHLQPFGYPDIRHHGMFNVPDIHKGFIDFGIAVLGTEEEN